MAGLFARRARRPADVSTSVVDVPDAALLPAEAGSDPSAAVPAQTAPVSGTPMLSSVDAVMAGEAAVAAASEAAAAAAATGTPQPAVAERPSMASAIYNVVRELLRGLSSAFLSAHLSLLAWSMLPLALGWTPSVVVSGSMRPAIDVGDVVYYAPENTNTLAPGRVILFRADGRLISHRLDSRNDDGTFVTKGDANLSADSTPVRQDQVVGAARLVIPHIGKIALWTPENRGQAMTWAGLAVVSLIFVRGPKRSGKARRRTKVAA